MKIYCLLIKLLIVLSANSHPSNARDLLENKGFQHGFPIRIYSQLVFSYELKAHISTESFKNSTPKYPEKKKELEKLAYSLDENDNPVLMLVKLKE